MVTIIVAPFGEVFKYDLPMNGDRPRTRTIILLYFIFQEDLQCWIEKYILYFILWIHTLNNSTMYPHYYKGAKTRGARLDCYILQFLAIFISINKKKITHTPSPVFAPVY